MSPSFVPFVTSLVSFVVQLVLFTTIPLIVFSIQKRTIKGFGAWIGLKRAPSGALGLALLAAAVFSLVVFLFRSVLDSEGLVSGGLLEQHQKTGWSVWLIGTLLVTAWLKTGLTEEIFFRGFVAARLIDWLGFRKGNAVQALVFGILHAFFVLALPAEDRNLSALVLFFLAPTLAAWVMGYLNHVKGEGSIMPSWIMHGVGNTVAYTVTILLA